MARVEGELTPWQKKVAEVYGGGDFAYMTDMKEVVALDGDTLFLFLMIELDPGEDCCSWAEASRRLETAFGEIEDVRNKIDRVMPDEGEEAADGS